MAVPHPNDYALVVGISRYPGLPGKNGQKPSVLEGPIPDAEAISAWLRDPDGGGLDCANVTLIHSGQFPQTNDPADCAPAFDAINKALVSLIRRTQNRRARRLYLYMSGHGFAPDVDRGALLTAECDDITLPNIYASEWLNRFRGLGCFEEFVLWMDCCFENSDSIPVQMPPIVKAPLVGAGGSRFLGLAAQTGMQALECPIAQDGGRVHGVFTWTLLSGLRGGAQTSNSGQISGESLHDYLLNTMHTFIPAERLSAREISAAPYVVTDEGLLFGTPRAPQFTIRFSGRAADGHALTIWTGTPARQVTKLDMRKGAAVVSLPPGVYVAESNGSRTGFDVTSQGRDVALVDASPSGTAAPENSQCLLGVRAISATDGRSVPSAVLTVVNSKFERVGASLGELRATFDPGVYKIIVQFGSDIVNKTERIVLLDRDTTDIDIVAPSLLSPAPLADTAATHEYHREALYKLNARRTTVDVPPISSNEGSFEFLSPGRLVDRLVLRKPAADSAIGVMTRFWTESSPKDAASFPNPFEGLSIVRGDGDLICDLECIEYERIPDPVGWHAIEVLSGTYLLRQEFSTGSVFERPIIASPGWQTNVVIRRDSRDVGSTSPPRLRSMGSVSLHMAKIGSPDLSSHDASSIERQVEGWRVALRDRRKLDPREINQLLMGKFENPIFGIVGAHLALLGEIRFPTGASQQWLLEVVANLRHLLGDAHPDVEAISFSPAATAARGTIKGPPMYLRSWEIMADAVGDPDVLFSTEAWWRLRKRAFDPLYMVWIAKAKAKLEDVPETFD